MPVIKPILLAVGSTLMLCSGALAQFPTIQKISDTAGRFTGTLRDSDNLGYSMAGIGDVDDDGVDDIAVGVPFNDDGEGNNQGAVFILFMRPGGTVRAHQKISATAGNGSILSSNPLEDWLDPGDEFGRSVAGPGDLNGDGIPDLLVGAPGDDEGKVHILTLNREGKFWRLGRIDDFDLGRVLNGGDRFGESIAVIPDADGDGTPDLAVGAPLNAGSDRGAIYLLSLKYEGASDTGGTRVTSYTKISDSSGGLSANLSGSDAFGRSIASLGDLNGDGEPDLAVGASGDDAGAGNNKGAAYILLMNSDRTVGTTIKITENQNGFTGDTDEGDRFGYAMAALDLDDDGRRELVVGSPEDDDGSSNRGAAYILFLNSNGTVNRFEKHSATQGEIFEGLNSGDQLGRGVGVLPDLNGDGRAELGVGAIRDDDGGTNRGAVYVMYRDAILVNSTQNRALSNGASTRCTTGQNNSIGDPECTLRAAIKYSNDRPERDRIVFSIPLDEAGCESSSGLCTVEILNPRLPGIIDDVDIDATTQPKSTCAVVRPKVALDARGLTDIDAQVFSFSGSSAGSTVRGLSIYGSPKYAMRLVSGNHTIQCNILGSDPTGTPNLVNTSNNHNGGLWISGSSGNLVGTDGDGSLDFAEFNVISGTSRSGVIIGGDAQNNTIAGNLIGRAPNNQNPLPNAAHGILIQETATAPRNNTIGGSGSFVGNKIVYNTLDGIAITGSASRRNQIVSNEIFGNGGLGIDLNNDGISSNDNGDGDAGPNRLQNNPAINRAEIQNGIVTVEYTITTFWENANYPLHVEFFESDASGSWATSVVGSDTYNTQDLGVTSSGLSPCGNPPCLKTATFPAGQLRVGDRILATATDDAGNSSELSESIVISNPASSSGVVSVSARVFLQGAHRESVDTMDTGLSEFLPTVDPYGLGVSVDSDDFFVSSPDGRRIVDWLQLQLLAGDPDEAASGGDSLAIIDQQAGLLRNDGEVVALDGRAPVSFDAPDGLYWLAIQHRNGLAVLSGTALICLSGSCSYDFTATSAFGIDAQASLTGADPNITGLWAGDADQDGAVTTSDFARMIAESDAGATGYLAGDFDLDGQVGESDFALWRLAFGNVSGLPLSAP